jgi:hypothetical protein
VFKIAKNPSSWRELGKEEKKENNSKNKIKKLCNKNQNWKKGKSRNIRHLKAMKMITN